MKKAQQAQSNALFLRDLAEEARIKAEREQYYSNIGIAGFSIEQGAMEKARGLLLENTPPLFRSWEWGRLIAELYPEDMQLLNNQQMFHAIWSPDGDRIYTGDYSHVVAWDAYTGRPVWSSKVGNNAVWSLDISGDGSTLLSGSFDQDGTILDAETGKVIHLLDGHQAAIRSAGISPDGTMAFTGASDGTLILWNTKNGQQITRVDNLVSSVYHGKFSPSGKYLVIATKFPQLSILNPQNGEVLRSFNCYGAGPSSATFSPDEKYVIASFEDYWVRTYDAETTEFLRHVDNRQCYPHFVDISPDGKLLATGDDMGRGRLWDFASGELLGEFQTDDPMWKLEFSPSGGKLLTTSRRSVRVVDVSRVLKKGEFHDRNTREELVSVPDKIKVFALPNVRWAEWQNQDWRWQTSQGVTRYKALGRSVLIESNYVANSPDYRLRVEINPQTQHASIVDSSTNEIKMEINDRQFIDSAFSPDGKYIALAEFESAVRIYDSGSLELVHVLDKDPSRRITDFTDRFIIHVIQFHPEKNQLAVGYFNSLVSLWDCETGELVADYTGVEGIGSCIAFDPTGKYIAAGGNDDTAAVWNQESKELVSVMTGHQRTLVGIAFNNTGDRIATISNDFSAKLWDPIDGREVLTLLETNQEDRPLGIGFSNDGENLYIATASKKVYAFDTLPWNIPESVDLEGWSMERKLELWKRMSRVSPDVVPQDVVYANRSDND